MEEARTTFLRWHLASIALNLVTIVCVTGAMAMAGNLEIAPTKAPKPRGNSDEESTVEMPVYGRRSERHHESVEVRVLFLRSLFRSK